MRSLNKVQLIGNLGQEPDIRHTQDGKQVANLSVATSDSWNDKHGQRQEKTEWHRVAIFGKLAEIAQQYLRKGSKVFLEGTLRTRKWTDNQGQDRYSTEVVLNGFDGKMIMLDGKNENHAPAPQTAQQPAPAAPAPQQFDDGDIPF